MCDKKRRRKSGVKSIQKLSIAESSFTLINTVLGADLLTLPRNVGGVGWGAFLILQAASAVVCGHSFATLAVEAEIVKAKDYQFVVKKILGRTARFYASFSLLFYLFFTLLGFAVALKDSMFFFSESDLLHRNVVMWLILALFMVPLSLVKDLSQLAATSFLAVLSVLYLLLYMVAINILIATGNVQTPQHFNSPITLNTDPMSFLSNFSVQTLYYTGHFNAINVYNQLKNKSIKRMQITSCISAGFIFIINIGIGLAGYFIFTDSVSTNVIKSINKLGIDRFNGPTGVANVCMMLITISSYPLVCFCFRMTMSGIIFGEFGAQNQIFHYTFTILTGAVLGIIASFLTDIGPILNLASTVAGIPLVLVFPAFLRFKVSVLKRFEPRDYGDYAYIDNDDIEELVNRNYEEDATIERIKQQIRENHITQCFSIVLGVAGILVTILGITFALWDIIQPVKS